ncbi:hypothetical protein [Streptomyces flavidovirens]|uniref:hypothetical protein n=1 Tax=Streptomyces flavidovirens TaxID=67298 RepID=UPI003681583B
MRNAEYGPLPAGEPLEVQAAAGARVGVRLPPSRPQPLGPLLAPRGPGRGRVVRDAVAGGGYRAGHLGAGPGAVHPLAYVPRPFGVLIRHR